MQVLIFGFALAFFALIIYWFFQKRQKDSEKNRLKLFISRADKIQIDLDKVDIKSNSWKEENFLNSSSAKLDQLAGDSNRGKEVVYHNLNTLIFTLPYKNSTLRVTESVNMERKTLEMKLAIKEETTLYIILENII